MSARTPQFASFCITCNRRDAAISNGRCVVCGNPPSQGAVVERESVLVYAECDPRPTMIIEASESPTLLQSTLDELVEDMLCEAQRDAITRRIVHRKLDSTIDVTWCRADGTLEEETIGATVEASLKLGELTRGRCEHEPCQRGTVGCSIDHVTDSECATW